MGEAEIPKVYSDHTMAGKQLPRRGIAGDRRVAHVHHRVLDIGVAQSVLYLTFRPLLSRSMMIFRGVAFNT